MNISTLISKHFHEAFFGGNWTWSNVKDQLSDVTWEEASQKIDSFNTIAALTFHINYFVEALTDVLEGRELTAHDKFSYDVPEIRNQEDWETLKEKSFTNAERLTELIAQLPDEKLINVFVQDKYGNYYRNLHGLIEHTHYHLGQIVIIKKMIRIVSHR